MKSRVITILQELECLRESLFALSDDIWRNINHNDENALDEGYQFKKNFNKKMIDFDKASAEISEMTQKFLKIEIDNNEMPDENERIIQSLNNEKPYSLSDDFCYKRPYGFLLKGKAFKNITTWRRLYGEFCRQLAIIDPERFRGLPDNPKFIGRRNRCFSRDPEKLYVKLEIANGVYAEGNSSANSMRDNMKKLLEEFGIDPEELKIFLREDRNAESE